MQDVGAGREGTAGQAQTSQATSTGFADAAMSGANSIILSSREEAIPHVISWLGDTYGEKEGATLLKKDVYRAYVAFCAENNFECTNAASFGKIFKRVFPRVQMARLVVDKGKKGWHYSGLAPKRRSSEAAAGSDHAFTDITRRRRRERRNHRRQDEVTAAYDDEHPPIAADSIHSHEVSCPPLPTTTTATTPAASLMSARSPIYIYPSTILPFILPCLPASPSSDLSPAVSTTTVRTCESREAAGVSTKRKRNGISDRPSSTAPSSPRVSNENKRHKQNQSGDDPEASLSLSSPYASRSSRPAAAQRAGVWNSNSHLYLIETLHQYCRVFRVESWPVFPINPACLKLGSLQYLITTEEGAHERSPLALCTYFALSCGAIVVGNIQRSREFWLKSREILGDLIDSNDYDVACVLRHSANLSRVFDEAEGRMATGLYYLTLSKRIHERIGALNDENYESTLKSLSVLWQIPTEKEMQHASRQPKWNKNWRKNKLYISQYKFGQVAEIVKDYVLDALNGIIAAVLDTNSNDRSAGLAEGLMKLKVLEDALDQIENGPRGAPRQLFQILRAIVYFLSTICHRHISSREVAMQSFVQFIRFLTTKTYMSAFVITWTELSSMPLFASEMPILMCNLIDAGQLALLQTLFQMLRPLTQELDWVHVTFRQLIAAIEHEYTVRRKMQAPPILSSPDPSPTLPPLSPGDASFSTLHHLPLSASISSSSTTSPPLSLP